MEPTRHFLRLVDDPVGSILWMLRRLPLERTAAYLALISQQAGRLGLVSGEDKARIDFAWPEPISPYFPALTAEANAIVEAGRPIESAFSDEAAERRFWKIEGFAAVPCGGTHLRSTAEVGAIRLKRKNIGKGKERIEIYVD